MKKVISLFLSVAMILAIISGMNLTAYASVKQVVVVIMLDIRLILKLVCLLLVEQVICILIDSFFKILILNQ